MPCVGAVRVSLRTGPQWTAERARCVRLGPLPLCPGQTDRNTDRRWTEPTPALTVRFPLHSSLRLWALRASAQKIKQKRRFIPQPEERTWTYCSQR